ARRHDQRHSKLNRATAKAPARRRLLLGALALGLGAPLLFLSTQALFLGQCMCLRQLALSCLGLFLGALALGLGAPLLFLSTQARSLGQCMCLPQLALACRFLSVFARLLCCATGVEERLITDVEPWLRPSYPCLCIREPQATP